MISKQESSNSFAMLNQQNEHLNMIHSVSMIDRRNHDNNSIYHIEDDQSHENWKRLDVDEYKSEYDDEDNKGCSDSHSDPNQSDSD